MKRHWDCAKRFAIIYLRYRRYYLLVRCLFYSNSHLWLLSAFVSIRSTSYAHFLCLSINTVLENSICRSFTVCLFIYLLTFSFRQWKLCWEVHGSQSIMLFVSTNNFIVLVNIPCIHVSAISIYSYFFSLFASCVPCVCCCFFSLTSRCVLFIAKHRCM